MARRSAVAVIETPEHVDIPLWREITCGVEYCALKTSRVYYGFGIPKGNGEPVVVVPGFLGNDWYLIEMYLWLSRIGYKPYFSRIGHNAQCPDKLMHRLLATVNRAYAATGKPVHLIGHSFGGVLSRGVTVRKPERIASVTTLGSPFGGVRVNPWILRAIAQVRQHTHRAGGRRGKDCFTESCACGFLCTMDTSFPRSVPQTAIYTKTDGVVDWEVCKNDDETTDVEVSGTHIGLAWNPQVFKTIAERLHAANEQARSEDLIFMETPNLKRKRKKAAAKPRKKAAKAKVATRTKRRENAA